MAARLKKWPPQNENKLTKLEKLQLTDILCTICQSILVEPVTLPCFHDFCLTCFNGSIENNSLSCPLCRLRIGSWLRNANKGNKLINVELWKFIQERYHKEVSLKLNGEDLVLPQEIPVVRLSNPGQIRLEYETELARLKAERLEIQEKHMHDSEILIRKIQKEEKQALKHYQEKIKEDEIFAAKLQKQLCSPKSGENTTITKVSKLKATKMDEFLSKKTSLMDTRDSVLTDDTSSTDSSTSNRNSNIEKLNKGSPELVPRYGNLFKNFIGKKFSNVTGFWQKKEDNKKNTSITNNNINKKDIDINRNKGTLRSLPISLPYTGLLQQKNSARDKQITETDSVDSMKQELCYFKPIETPSPSRGKKGVVLPVRVPGLKIDHETNPVCTVSPPSQAQYLESLCQLRNNSITQNVPSAFVLLLKAWRLKKENSLKCNEVIKIQRTVSVNNSISGLIKTTKDKHNQGTNNVSDSSRSKTLKRTRSMGCLTKTADEITPKKIKNLHKKPHSERKPYLRSDSKRAKCSETVKTPDRSRIKLAMKNLSSPLNNCNIKELLEEQHRIERMIEQEKRDLELAHKVDEQLNGVMHLRRGPLKRQVTLKYALRPVKKLKV